MFLRFLMNEKTDIIIYFSGSSEEDEVSGFFVLSHLWMRGYFRLSQFNECPAGLENKPAGVRKRRKLL